MINDRGEFKVFATKINVSADQIYSVVTMWSEIVVSTELCFKIPHLLIWSMGSLLSDLEPSPPLDSPASSTEETTFSASASELRLASSRMAASLTADAEADAGAGRTAFTGGRM